MLPLFEMVVLSTEPRMEVHFTCRADSCFEPPHFNRFFFFSLLKKRVHFFCQCKQVSVLPYAFWCRKPKKTAALVLSCGFAPTPLFSDGLSFLPELLSSCFFYFFFICVLKSFGTEAVFPDRQSRAVAKHRLHSFLIGLLDSLLWCS